MSGLTRYIFVCQFLLAFGCLAIGQTPNPNSNKSSTDVEAKSAHTLKVETLVLLAHTAPPEVAADVLLSLAEIKPLIPKTRKRELIEDAFRFARDAREAVKRRPWSRMVDTRSGLKGAAFDLELDRLSLQTRAVTEMIGLDKARARTMFQEIFLPKLPALTCEDSLSYDYQAYYRTALAISQNCFDENEKKAEAHIQFLSDRLDDVKSISQVMPAAQMIAEAGLTSDELSLLISRFVDAIGKVSTNAREFAFFMNRERVASCFWTLNQKAGQQKLPNGDLNRALRTFLTRQMSSEVCLDAPWLDGRTVKLTKDVTDLNEFFPKPIVDEDVRPASFGAPAKDRQFWIMPREKQLLMLAKDLRFGDEQQELTLEQRKTDEWRKKMVDYLGLIESWEPESEVSAADFFNEKWILYGVLVDLSPDDAQRDIVLRAYASYLREQDAEYKGRIEWILPVKDYLRRIRSRPEAEQRKSLDPWLSSSNAALRAYGELALLGVSKVESAIP